MVSANSENVAKQTWPWPDALDALTAAPDHHTLVFENESVRVVRARIPPGDMVPVHTHRWPSVLFIFSWSAVIRRDRRGQVIPTAPGLREPIINTPTWQGPLPPHSVENIGDAEISTVQVEIKGFA